MTLPRIIGVVLLVVGVVLAVIGFNASDSVVDQVHNTFTGRFTDKTMWYIIGGIACAVLGLVLTFVPMGKRIA